MACEFNWTRFCIGYTSFGQQIVKRKFNLFGELCCSIQLVQRDGKISEKNQILHVSSYTHAFFFSYQRFVPEAGKTWYFH